MAQNGRYKAWLGCLVLLFVIAFAYMLICVGVWWLLDNSPPRPDFEVTPDKETSSVGPQITPTLPLPTGVTATATTPRLTSSFSDTLSPATSTTMPITPIPVAVIPKVQDNNSSGFTLVSPDSKKKLPANIDTVEFHWRWSERPSCGAPLNPYGFEVRVWPVESSIPLGIMDAATERRFIFCNPDTGVFDFKIRDIRDAPGVGRRETGIGKFYWDVAYVHLNPYYPISSSESRIFEITLDYTGPLDPHGVDLDCSDFTSWGEAQSVYLASGGPVKDLHGLDPNGDEMACDRLR